MDYVTTTTLPSIPVGEQQGPRGSPRSSRTARDRASAIDRKIAALDGLTLEGVPTTREFCRFALDPPGLPGRTRHHNWIATRDLPDFMEKDR